MENPTKGIRTCSICQKTFKRTEHCLRHERAHRRERPFPCRFCERAYGRKDLLVRHEKTLHAVAWAKAQEDLKLVSDQSIRHRRSRQKRPTSSGDQKEESLSPNLAENLHPSTYLNNQRATDFPDFLSSTLNFPQSDGCGDDGTGICGPQILDLAFPLDPLLIHQVDMLSNRGASQQDQVDGGQPSEHFLSPSLDQSFVDYSSPREFDFLPSFQPHNNIPLDPHLTEVSHHECGDLSQRAPPEKLDVSSSDPCMNANAFWCLPFDRAVSSQDVGSGSSAWTEDQYDQKHKI